MSFVERSIILCPYLGGSTIGGSTVYMYRYSTKLKFAYTCTCYDSLSICSSVEPRLMATRE